MTLFLAHLTCLARVRHGAWKMTYLGILGSERGVTHSLFLAAIFSRHGWARTIISISLPACMLWQNSVAGVEEKERLA